MDRVSDRVLVLADAQECGRTAARQVADAITAAIERHGCARVLFASAPSQESMLEALARSSVDWSRVEAFHIDEYLGLAANHPSAFGTWLSRRLPTEHMINFHRLDPAASDADIESERYAALLASAPLDVGCLGVGVNGHIAFNEPGSDPDESRWVKPVTIDTVSRQQQVDDRCFEHLEDVPRRALTLTIPALLSCESIVVTVLGRHKAEAVAAAVAGPVDAACPASLLQTHADVRINLDRDAASLAG